MTIKEAILKSLEHFPQGAKAADVYSDIVKHGYYTFDKGLTPIATVNALMWDFIKKGDNRVIRSKDAKGVYNYYLAKYKENIEVILDSPQPPKEKAKSLKTFVERDLHRLFVTFLHGQDILSKTIFHETSSKKEEHKKWIHPDIIGAHFVEHTNKSCQSFFKATNRQKTVEIYSYELKKSISSDYELKMCYFQAVSNSSWANYGFLVSFYFGDNLHEELERLNESFGIGIILLKPNPHESKVLFPAKRHELDFKTINKLCIANSDFSSFFEQIEKVMTADPKFAKDVKKGLSDLCDKPIKNDSEIIAYCNEKGIPLDEEQEEI